MLRTKLNRPQLSDKLVKRDKLVEKLNKCAQLPLVLISAPAGYGKSILVSQWLALHQQNQAWLSLDEKLNDSSTFITYFIEMLKRLEFADTEKLKKLEQEYHYLSWEAIIDMIVNMLNELKEQLRIILDDYHIISNHKIHELIEALIRVNIPNLQVVIITRWDPPFHLRELRLYQKMGEFRIKDLKFKESEIAQLFANEKQIKLSKAEINDLTLKTEGWILAIRVIIGAQSFPEHSQKKEKSLFISNDLESLIDHISDNLDPRFFRQMQLCALCDHFNVDLIDSIFTYALKDSSGVEEFLAKLRDINFSLIPVGNDDEWYRFHHLIGDILRRQLERSEPDIIKPLYLKISEWFSEKNLIDETIHYAIKAENYELACEQIIKHRASVLDQGHWWVVQHWLSIIPRQIRASNVDLLLTELLICEETWNLQDFSSILDTLKSIGIEDSSDENISRYLFHLGYFLTFVKPDPKKALESLERSIALCQDESYMFGGRRELIVACSKQMLGLTALALTSLEDIQKKSEHSSKLHARAIHGKVLVHLLSGNFESASNDSQKLLFLVRDSELLYAKGWSLYFLGNVAFQSYHTHEVINALKGALALEGKFNYRVFFDALAGLIIFNSLKGDKKATELFLMQMSQVASKLKDTQFQKYYYSARARVSWHTGQGDKELSWAQTDWVKQAPASYLFLMDVPELTKIRIVVSHGSHVQVEESVSVLGEMEAKLESLHNHYQQTDILLLKAMGLLRLGKKNLAMESLKKALSIAEKKDILRPVLEAYQVMPSLFNSDHITDFSAHRILSRIGVAGPDIKEEPVKPAPKEALSLREEEIVRLVADGLRSKEIADNLNISILTVKTHLTNIYRKLKVPNRTSMINKVRNRLII